MFHMHLKHTPLFWVLLLQLIVPVLPLPLSHRLVVYPCHPPPVSSQQSRVNHEVRSGHPSPVQISPRIVSLIRSQKSFSTVPTYSLPLSLIIHSAFNKSRLRGISRTLEVHLYSIRSVSQVFAQMSWWHSQLCLCVSSRRELLKGQNSCFVKCCTPLTGI